MSSSITCPACAASFRLREDTRGKKMFCPKCGQPMVITSAGVAKRGEAAPVAAAARRGVPWSWLAAAVVLVTAISIGVALLLHHQRQPPPDPGAVAARETDPEALDGKLRRLADGPAPAPQAPTTSAPAQPPIPTPVASKPTPQPTAPPPPAPPAAPPASPPPEKPALSTPPAPAPVPPLGGVWLAITPDGKTLASGDGTAVRLWDVAAGKVSRTVTAPNGYGFTSLALSRDGKTLVTGASQSQTDNPIVLWDVASGRFLKAMNPVADTPRVTATPTQSRFVGPGLSWTSMKLPAGAAQSAAFSPDGRTVATAGDGMLHLYDVASGRNTAALGYTFPNGPSLPPVPGLNVGCVKYTPDGKSLLSGGTDGILRWWNTATGKEYAARSAGGVTGASLMVALSPDGKTLASWMPGGKEIRLWDALQGTSLQTLTTDYLVNTVAFSSDGKTLASGGGLWDAKQMSAELKLWNVASGQNAATLKGHTDPLNALVFSPDGKTLFSQSTQDIKLWDVASGQHVRILGR